MTSQEDHAVHRADEWINQETLTHARYHMNTLCFSFTFVEGITPVKFVSKSNSSISFHT